MKILLVLLLLMAVMTGCKKGTLIDNPPKEPIELSSVGIVDYTPTKVFFSIQGTIIDDELVPLANMQFYSSELCSGQILGEVLVQDFPNSGITLELNPGDQFDIYMNTEGNPDCVKVTSFNGTVLQPEAPVFSRTSPESPTRDSLSPGVFGSVFPESSTIKFYDDSSCSSLIGLGLGSLFETAGIAISVGSNQTTEVYAKTIDLNNSESSCSKLTDFVHTTNTLASPVFVSISQPSPNAVTTEVVIVGSVDPASIGVTLYSDSACSLVLVSGGASAFENTGLPASMNANDSTLVYSKSVDADGVPSTCTYLTTYTHDTLPPGAPVFVSADPASPTKDTTFPKMQGTVSSDTLSLKLYDSFLCVNQVGAGTATEFTGSGITANVKSNDTTSIYAISLDFAGNESDCTYFTGYTHNTLAPPNPILVGTTPLSPTNQSTTPRFYGTPSDRTVLLNFYDDELCANLVGSGTDDEYSSPGVTLTLSANTTNSVYVTAIDEEGNVASCDFLGDYAHSVLPAPSPSFMFSFPSSPSRVSYQPFIVGNTDPSIASVELFDDAICSNLLGSGSRATFTSSGVQVTLSDNSTNDIYAVATDIYGNTSSCTSMFTYVHTAVQPLNPTFSASDPVSPNNQSYSPLLTGSSLMDPSSQLPPLTVSFYDSLACIGKIGEGTPAEFSSTGITVNAAPDSVSSIYARAIDAAGNKSSCTYLMDYTHNSLKPGAPIFLSTIPGSPSYSENVNIKGTYQVSPDFMNKVSVGIYTDSGCSALLSSDAPSAFESTGVSIIAPANTITALYGDSVNEVGTKSDCTLLNNFRHHDLPLNNLSTTLNSNGSVYLIWNPDLVSTPQIYYTIERSESPTGPFKVVSKAQSGITFTDTQVAENSTYYYRVYALNNTGRSQYSGVASVTVLPSAPTQANSLSATSGNGEVKLLWSGFAENMSYKVYRSTSSGGPYTYISHVESGTQYNDSTVVNDSTYYYIVIAQNPSGLSVQSSEASVTPKPIPPAPTNFQISFERTSSDCGGASGMYFSWSPSEYYNSFNLVEGNVGSKSSIQSLSEPAATVCGFPSSGINNFAVTSKWGQDSSLESDTIRVFNSTGTSIDVKPGDGINYISMSVFSVPNLTNTPPIQYDLFKAVDSNGPYTKILDGVQISEYTDNAVVQGSSYFYYAHAYMLDPNGERVYVGWPSAIDSAIPRAIPSAPTDLVLGYNESLKSVNLNWGRTTHYNNYKVYRAASIGGPYTVVSLPTVNYASSVSKSNGMNFYYVTSQWGDSESAQSNIVSFRYNLIEDLATNSGVSSISLNWSNVSGVTNYSVYRSTEYEGADALINNTATSDYVDNSAVSGQGYFYKVKANFPDATSTPYSNTKSAMLTDSNTPSGISAVVTSLTSAKVYWAPIDNVTSYKILSSSNIGGPYVQKASTTSTEKAVNGLNALSENFIKVRAVVSSTNFDSTPISVKTIRASNPPSLDAGNNSVTLNWTAASGAANYDILRSEDNVSFSTVATNQPTLTYVDASAVNATSYYYRIRANFTGLGTADSTSSTVVTPGLVPNATTGLRVSKGSTNAEVLLSWSAVDGSSKYHLYSSTSPGGPYVTPDIVTSSNSNVSLVGLTPGTPYYFIVRAVIGEVESADSNEVAFIPNDVPAAPTVSNNANTSVDIDWVAVPGASTYNVFRSENGKHYAEIANSVSAITYNDVVPDPSQSYYYKYQGVSAAGIAMPDSDASAFVVIGGSQLSPTNLVVEATDNTAVELRWAPASNAEAYKIYRSASSGGPYSEITSVGSSTLSYSDATVVAGSSYFYVVTALNSSTVESPNSNEQGVDLNGAPQNVALSNASTGIQITWDVFAGAVAYTVKRSAQPSGPYGIISSGVATNSYVDTEVTADHMYYYVIEAELASLANSEQSSEGSITRTGSIKLQVPIELADRGFGSSNASDVTFLRTQTSFDTDDYDGVTSYEFEVNTTNTDSSIRNIYLVDSSDITVATIAVPALTLDSTRMKVSFTPNAGRDVYKVKVDQTAVNLQVLVNSSRILVNQVDATKTKIYIPMLSSSEFATSADAASSVFSSNQESYAVIPSYIKYVREASKYDKIVDYNAWELEALVATTNSARGSMVLYNDTENEAVDSSELIIESGAIQLATVPIHEGDSQFNTSHEGDEFSLQLKCLDECSSGAVEVYKSGLWVKLENLTKAMVYYRVTTEKFTETTQVDYSEQRLMIDTNLFSNPIVNFQVEATDSGVSSATIMLRETSNDFGTAGLADLLPSQLMIDADERTRVRTAAPIAVGSGKRVITNISPVNGEVQLHNSQVLIEFSKP